MNFIFKYVWFAKILLLSYWMTFTNRILRRFGKYIMQFPSIIVINPLVEVNDIKYEIIYAHTNTMDITKQFRLFCYINDIIFLDELMDTIPHAFRGCDRLRLLVKSDTIKSIEIDILKKLYIGERNVKIEQNQLIFDF